MKTVLVIDDEDDILLALELFLSDEGFRVIKAAHGRDALDRMAENHPDLILMDYMMPVLNGVETLKLIRDDPDYRSIPVILMSAVQRPSGRGYLGWDAFLRKPFDTDELLRVIGHVLK